jgi:anaerobic dimethyl sulfoxide reductase subunit C (anchor subunit)
MRIQDFALITFTILMQLSVGAFVVLAFARLYATRKANVNEADRLSDRALYWIVPIVILGLLASLLHLGDPLGAYRAINNFGTSWLSREIAFSVAFTLLATLYTFLQWRKILSVGLRNVLAWITALVGLGLVYIMGNVYLLDAQPAWNTWVTPVTFFLTTFLLGTLAIGAVFVATYASVKRREPEHAKTQLGLVRDIVRWIAISAVILLGIQVVILPLYLATLGAGPTAAAATAALLVGPFGWALILRIALVFLGAGVVGMFLYQNAQSTGKENALGNLAYTSFVLVLAAEVIGRYLFYATHVRLGI